MKHYVYMTINVINYKKYIGITHKSINSGYIGSGSVMKKAISKYGKSFFIRHDLFEGSLQDASNMEKYYIAYYDATNNKDFYNLRHGGFDGKHGITSIEKMKKAVKQAWETNRQIYIESFKTRDNSHLGKYDKTGVNNPMYGKNHTPESRQKMSKSRTGIKMNVNKQKLSDQIKGNSIMMGKKSNMQKAKNRWSALSKNFSKDPVVFDDLHMMHDYYGIHDSMSKLPKEHLEEYMKFRFRFLQEELDEGLKAIDEKNAEEVCDALIDLIVVAVGTLDLYQVDFKKAWYDVLKANMNKKVGVKASRPNPWGLPDLIKEQGWTAPSHEGNTGLIGKIYGDDNE